LIIQSKWFAVEFEASIKNEAAKKLFAALNIQADDVVFITE